MRAPHTKGYPRSESETRPGSRSNGHVAAEEDFGSVPTLGLRANKLALVTRHATIALAGCIAVIASATTRQPSVTILFAVATGWALYRLSTRSLRGVYAALDWGFVLAICAATPVPDTELTLVPLANFQTAVLSVALIGFAVALPLAASLPIAVVALGVYAWRSATATGWRDVALSLSMQYLITATIMSVLLRLTLLRAEAAAKRAHADLMTADTMRARVAAARRDYEAEQYALIHDTAASTLLLVAEGTPIPSSKLAAQARSALEVLKGNQMGPSRPLMELVGAVRNIAAAARTPVRLTGRSELWIDGEVGGGVEAATREVLNNVDRHAGATQVTIEISDDRLVATDDGRGIEPNSASGQGISGSVIDRMSRVGGTAILRPADGRGTTVELVWSVALSDTYANTTAVTEQDRLVAQVRRRYGLSLTGWALLVAALSVPATLAPNADGQSATQLALGLATVGGCLAGLPMLFGRASGVRWIGVTVLITVTVLQPLTLPAQSVGTRAQWSLWVCAWGLSALLLGRHLRTAVQIVGVYWIFACVATMVRAPLVDTAIALAFLMASLGVLMVASQFANSIFSDAVAHTHARTQAHLDLLARQRAALSAHRNFQRTVAEVRRRVEPLLVQLTTETPVDDDLRKSAQIESERIRAFLNVHSLREHALLRALRPALDAAARRNVEVTVHSDGELPVCDRSVIEPMSERLARIIDECHATARVVLTAADGQLIVSIVCRGYAGELDRDDDTMGSRTEVVRRDDTTWITICQDLSPASE